MASAVESTNETVSREEEEEDSVSRNLDSSDVEPAPSEDIKQHAERESVVEEEQDLDLTVCARAFAEFLHVDASSQASELEESIEHMLRHVEEFCGVLGMIQTNTAFALQQKIPEIHAKAVQMREMYKKIDDLQHFIVTVRRNVNEMEDCISVAEKQFGSNVVTRALKTFSVPGFVSRQRGVRPTSKAEPRWDPPQIFNTDDFFAPSDSPSSSVDQTANS